jgi:hypothetical protein
MDALRAIVEKYPVPAVHGEESPPARSRLARPFSAERSRSIRGRRGKLLECGAGRIKDMDEAGLMQVLS